MATVRLSTGLRQEVTSRITAMFVQQIKEAETRINTYPAGVEIYERFHMPKANEYAEKLNNTGNGIFVNPLRQIRCKFTYVDRHDGSEKTLERCYDIPEHLELYAPIHWRTNAFFSCDIPEDMKVYDFVVEEMSTITRIKAQHATLYKRLMEGVWDKCKTLAQVIEHWPTVLDFVPDNVRAQHYAKTEKRAKVVIDTVSDDVKAILITNRMITNT